ncbi:hypothetical protein PSU4_54770 [Pseudonocardia sulfidoxydans NBRC 16205]|uniref:Uncharacterized protein n=1 Tax=Pseudonocardia sulfidoxydans NBRC 16205 TaxID=1223511 RepID=A0A511DQK7_9PSEU|nr:hypothetical protein [Pseudonocardia sulfidoxydans]GEL26523.1 hypothetical protein PSU4_54770 [Pseudonocardia sulfidoxydans NBRC 16205]
MAQSLIRVVDEPLNEGPYLLVSTHAWWRSSHSLLQGRVGIPQTRYVTLSEHRKDCWFPADPAGDWFLDQWATGRRIWLLGSEEQARADGMDLKLPERKTATSQRNRQSAAPDRHGGRTGRRQLAAAHCGLPGRPAARGRAATATAQGRQPRQALVRPVRLRR